MFTKVKLFPLVIFGIISITLISHAMADRCTVTLFQCEHQPTANCAVWKVFGNSKASDACKQFLKSAKADDKNVKYNACAAGCYAAKCSPCPKTLPSR
jgi:hypothetical protein